MIKVHTLDGKVYEGHLFAVDPVTKAVVLRDQESFRMISHSQISSIEGDISASPVPDVTEFGLRINSLEKKEQFALDNAEKSISALNFEVSPNIQTLYDRLSFIFPCKWQGKSMIVLDNFRIDPPYENVLSIATSGEDAGLERVIKVLEGERKKLKL